jgi:uncharacterized membrane-anchored protein
MSSKIAIAALLIILAVVNWSIAAKEKHLAEGKIVYLHLAPVDPRSLMQGDYMALRFSLANEVYKALPKTSENRSWDHNVDASDGYVVASLNEQNIASFKRLSNDKALSQNEVLMQYRVRNGAVKFATNAFFFQEGHGEVYQAARFGQFSIDDKGTLLLVAMYDKELNRLTATHDNKLQ